MNNILMLLDKNARMTDKEIAVAISIVTLFDNGGDFFFWMHV